MCFVANRLIENLFIEASFMFTHTNGLNVDWNARQAKDYSRQLNASQQAFAFIRGTGLDIMVQSYGIDYDVDELRYYFYKRFHVKD